MSVRYYDMLNRYRKLLQIIDVHAKFAITTSIV